VPDMRTSMPSPRFAPLIAGLPATVPFVGPEAQERMRGRPFRARIGANESVFGPSPRAIEAMCEAAATEMMVAVWMRVMLARGLDAPPFNWAINAHSGSR
jgi:hypothetical protein